MADYLTGARLSVRGILILALFNFLAAGLWQAVPAQQTDQPQGIRSKPAGTRALTGVKIHIAPGRVIEKGTVLIEDGKILAVGEDVELPAHATEINLSGSTVYPGFFDGYQPLDIEREEGDRGTAYWNTAIRPQLKVLDYIARDDELNDALRKQGMTARLVAPRGAILQGRSVLLSTADQPPSLTLLRAGVSQHLRLTVPPGGGRGSYPNSPMGSVALPGRPSTTQAGTARPGTPTRPTPACSGPKKTPRLKS